MSVLDRKLRRELLGAKLQLASIVAISAVGVACYVTMTSAHYNLERSRQRYYAQCRMADFWVSLKKAPLSAVAQVANLPGVVAVRPRISFQATVDLDGEPKPLSGRVISMPQERRPVINDLVMMRGSYFGPQRRNEVIVNDAFARQRGLHPGGRIHLILNNRRQELVIVGTALSAEFVYQISPGGIVPDSKDYGIFYVKHAFAEEAYDFQGACNELVGLVAPRYRDRPDELLDRVEAELDDYGVFTTTPRRLHPSHRFLSDEIAQLRTFSAIMASIFLAVAALVLNVMITRLVEQQRTIVGTLKALGYTRGQVFGHYLKYGLAIGVLGGAAGAALGQALALGMMHMYQRFFEFPQMTNRPYPGVIAVGVGMSVAFALAGTLRAVRTVARLSPAQAMRPKAPPIGRRIVLERWRALWRRLGFQWQTVLRDTFRQKMRTVAGVFAAAAGAAILFMTFVFYHSLVHMLDFTFEKLMRSDYELVFKDEHGAAALLEARRTLPGVDEAEPVFNVACTLAHGHRSKRTGVTGLVRGAQLTVPHDTSGRAVRVPEVGLLISRGLANLLDAEPGDTLTLTPIKGERRPRSVPVVKIVDSYIGLAAYADFDYLNRLVGAEHAVSAVQLKVKPGRDTQLAFFHELKRRPAIQTVNRIRDDKQKLVATFLDNMVYSLSVLIGFAGVIFFGSVLTASLIALAERQAQVGTFRVLGFTSAQVAGLFWRQNVLVNGAGALVGLPLGYLLARVTIAGSQTEFFRFPIVVKPSAALLTLALAMAFTFLAQVIVYRDIVKLNWLEALKVKE